MAQDWSNTPIPVSAGTGQTWQLLESHSDQFNYTGKTAAFTNKWKDSYFNGWLGPGLTEWASNHSYVADGNLILRSSRKAGTNKVNTGIITSKTKVKYPVYMEARILVNKLELSSNFWFLSEDAKKEIDVLEVYGGASSEWFAKNMSTNFHVFYRDPNDNSIISDFNAQNHIHAPNNGKWSDTWHTYGVYWKSPTDVRFFIDGVESTSGSWQNAVMKDKDYTGAILDKSQYNMSEELFMILDTEDHEWRSNAGIIASDADLANNSKNKMYVDWVRTYKPVATATNAPIGQTIWLKANNGSGKYVCAEKSVTNNPLEADRNSVGAWEKFTVENAGNGLIALKASSTNTYVSARIDVTGSPIRAYQTFIGSWEKFSWESQGTGKVALKANANGKYVQAQLHLTDAPLAAVGPNVQGWETFNWGTTSAKFGKQTNSDLETEATTMYPIPAKDKITISFNENDHFSSLQILNSNGQVLLQDSIDEKSGNKTIDLSNIADGMYILYLTGIDSKTMKFIKG